MCFNIVILINLLYKVVLKFCLCLMFFYFVNVVKVICYIGFLGCYLKFCCYNVM